MNPQLRNKLLAAGAAGTLAIAAVLGAWHEGDGPTKKIDGVTYHQSYVDPVGVWTVCRGLTGPVAGPGKKYTSDECRALEEQRLFVTELAVRRQLPNYWLYSKWRQAALVDFTYNVGEANLMSSTLRKRFNEGDDEGGCRELVRWVKGRVKGVLTTLNGLVTRRGDELELCLNWKD